MSLQSQYEFLVLLLMAVIVLELAARRLHLPPAAALIVGGMALAFVPGLPTIVFDPHLVLVVFLPPLLLSSAYATVWRDFKRHSATIGLCRHCFSFSVSGSPLGGGSRAGRCRLTARCGCC